MNKDIEKYFSYWNYIIYFIFECVLVGLCPEETSCAVTYV